VYHSIDEFLKDWEFEQAGTLKYLDALTDASLKQIVAPADRTLGRVAWHIVQTLPEMLTQAGLKVSGPAHDVDPPLSAKAIADAYRAACASFTVSLRAGWSNATLETDVPMYGETWKRGMVLAALMAHQTHHRGQMSVLMRQAGIKPPGIYGPAREDWAHMKMAPPRV